MRVSPDELNDWACEIMTVACHIHTAQDILYHGQGFNAIEQLEVAQELLSHLEKALQRAGAEKPHGPSSLVTPEVSIELQTSAANRRYAEALRMAYEALVDVEKERGHCGLGPSEILAGWLEEVYTEVYGPRGWTGAE